MKPHKESPEKQAYVSKRSDNQYPALVYNNIGKTKQILFGGIIVVLVTRGQMDITISGRDYTASRGTLLLIAPNSLCQVTLLSQDFLARVVPITLEQLLEMPTPIDTDTINSARRSPNMQIPESEIGRTEHLFDLVDEFNNIEGHTYAHEMHIAFLYALVLEVSHRQRLCHGEGTNDAKVRPERLSDDFFLLLAEHFKNERSVAFYAEQMHLTPKYLSGQIKQITGKSILEWINETVITEIKVMLKTTDLTVWQISEALNFSNPSAFVQYFKHHVGTTPLKYRRED